MLIQRKEVSWNAWMTPLQASDYLPATLHPSSTDSCQQSLSLAKVVFTVNISVNRMAKRAEGNLGTYAPGRRISFPDNVERLEPWDLFPLVQTRYSDILTTLMLMTLMSHL
jgi:hypothetical protein